VGLNGTYALLLALHVSVASNETYDYMDGTLNGVSFSTGAIAGSAKWSTSTACVVPRSMAPMMSLG